MDYHRILAEVAQTPLALAPWKIAQLQEFFLAKFNGVKFSREEIEAKIAPQTTRAVARREGAVAVLPIRGAIAQRINTMDDISGGGGTSTEIFSKLFNAALSDDAVKAIVLDVDSPGGSVYGVPELAAEIFQARKRKPIYGAINSLAASAAYWLVSQAEEIVVTPGGEAGSIGVYTIHFDESEAWKAAGVVPTVVKAGENKIAANPFGPLTEEAKAKIQGDVDTYYSMFLGAVANGRKISRAEVMKGFGQGDTFTAQELVSRGMADKVETLSGLLERLGVDANKPKEPAGKSVMRARHELLSL